MLPFESVQYPILRDLPKIVPIDKRVNMNNNLEFVFIIITVLISIGLPKSMALYRLLE